MQELLLAGARIDFVTLWGVTALIQVRQNTDSENEDHNTNTNVTGLFYGSAAVCYFTARAWCRPQLMREWRVSELEDHDCVISLDLMFTSQVHTAHECVLRRAE